MTSSPLRTLLPLRREHADAKVRLVCFPFLGGTAKSFAPWQELLPPEVDLCAVDLPGHGTRLGEEPFDAMAPVVEYLKRTLAPLVDEPVVLYGHSLGARIAFALALALGPAVRAVIVAAARAPLIPPPRRRADMSRADLVSELRRLGGTPPQVLADDEVMDLYLPIIRADYKLIESYAPSPDQKVSCPLLALAAPDDRETSLDEVLAWKSVAAGSFESVTMPGGHFFMTSHPREVVREVRRVLDAVV